MAAAKGDLTEVAHLDAKAECQQLARNGIDKVMREHCSDAVIAPTDGVPAWMIDPILGDNPRLISGGCSTPPAMAGYPRTSPCVRFSFMASCAAPRLTIRWFGCWDPEWKTFAEPSTHDRHRRLLAFGLRLARSSPAQRHCPGVHRRAGRATQAQRRTEESEFVDPVAGQLL
jgi:hypothetical protein